MIRFHAPVRSTTLNVYAVVVIVVTLEIQERIQHDDDDDPTTRNSSYHSWSFPLSLFFHPLFLRWSVLRHTIRTMGHLGFQNLMDLIVPGAGHVPHGSGNISVINIRYLCLWTWLKKGVNRWNWNLRYWSNRFFAIMIFFRLWIFKNDMSKKGKNIGNWILILICIKLIFYSYFEILGDLRNSE